MLYRFLGFELDDQLRELRFQGREVPLQPRVFDLLQYLVLHRDRVVSKDELLDAVWAGVVVTEASLQRAVSLARAVLRQGKAEDAIRTRSRHGYRFGAEVMTEDTGLEPPPAVHPVNPNGSKLEIEAWREADRERGLTAAELEHWGLLAYRTADLAAAVAALERAVAGYGAVGQREAAARCALLLCRIGYDRGELAVARGWHRRGVTLLEGTPAGSVHGLQEWLASCLAAAEGRIDAAVRHAERARDIGRAIGDVEIEGAGLAFLGLAVQCLGDLEHAVALQDEAAAAVLGGRVGPDTGGIIYCAVIYGCQNRGDWRRAAEWTGQFSRLCADLELANYPGLCQLHRAEVLAMRGDLEEAEHEAEHAGGILAVATPSNAGDCQRLLGDIRFWRGNLQGARQAYQQAHEAGWEPQPGWAWPLVEEGKSEAALRGLRRALDDPRWSSAQRRSLLLAHLAIISAQSGAIDSAVEILEQLDADAHLRFAPGVKAWITRGWAEVAISEALFDEAATSLQQLIHLWHQVGSIPYLADTRLRLAETLHALGDREAAALELAAATAAFERMAAANQLRRCAHLRQLLTH